MPWQRLAPTYDQPPLHTIGINRLTIDILTVHPGEYAYRVLERICDTNRTGGQEGFVELMPDDPQQPPQRGLVPEASADPKAGWTFRAMTRPEIDALDLAHLVGRRVVEAIHERLRPRS